MDFSCLKAGFSVRLKAIDLGKEPIMMDEKKIARINELYRKSKAEGLTDSEKKEQQILRREYIDSVKRNLTAQLDHISIQEADGTITELGKKYGGKRGN